MSSCGPNRLFASLPNAYEGALFLLLGLGSVNVHALPDDRDQPIHITADKALRDEVDGVTIYAGNVELVQGSMELEADKLTIYHTTDVADKIIARGRPAKMRQQPELDKGIVHAHARVITYFKSEDRVHLQTDARIEQEGAVVDGDAIDYFIAKQLITAESDKSKEDRVEVIIPPSEKNAGDSDRPPEQADVEAAVQPMETDDMLPEQADVEGDAQPAEEGDMHPGQAGVEITSPSAPEEEATTAPTTEIAQEGASGTAERE